jgi:hypothetical protein
MLLAIDMSTPRRPVDPALALLLLLLAGHFAVIVACYEHPLITDEVYYVAKARYLAEHHRFAPIDPRALEVERGRAWGNSDWRPAGYPLLVAAISLGDFRDPAGALRLRVTIVQFLMVAAALLALYRLAVDCGVEGRARYAAAVLLALPPWTFAVVNEIGPDPENLALVTFGLIALGRKRVVPAAILLSLTFFFRPEMIVLPPVLIGFALLAWHRTTFWRDAVVAASIYLALVGVQVAYRTALTGRPGVFGGLHIYNRGAFDWANTWVGTEKETYDFVYNLGEALPARVPDRAFDSDAERAAVERIVARVRARGVYAAEDDAEFERLAQEKARAHPLRVLALRGWHTVHLWLNVEQNNPLLEAMARVPRALRLPVWGALLLLRLAALALAAMAGLRAFRGRTDAVSRFVLLFLFFAVVRSLFIGAVLNWNVHRYVLSAWPPVLWCAAAALRPRQS